MRNVNLFDKMRRLLPGNVMQMIKQLAALAEKHNLRAYLVGGFVRDLLLGVRNLDIDLAVEGDAIEFARIAANELRASFVAHKKFGTATLIMKEYIKFKIDIATARTEAYEHPAALPSVSSGSIKDDLYRRDFTINAMAVSIAKNNFGELIDFFGGRRDLKTKTVRALHKKSFIDDPTRIFRAVRFAERYGFKIDRETVSFIKHALREEMFDRVSGERLRNEIELLLKEKEPLRAIKKMRDLHELHFIHPDIKFNKASESISGQIKTLYGRYEEYFLKNRPLDLWLVYFMALIDNLSLKETLYVCDRFAMTRGDRLRLIGCKKREKKAIRILTDAKDASPSRIYKVLEPLSYESLLFIMAKCGRRLVRRRAEDFLSKYSGVKLAIGGEDLKRLGIEPGPRFNKILKKTLYAKLNGKLSSKLPELDFAKRIARKGVNQCLREKDSGFRGTV